MLTQGDIRRKKVKVSKAAVERPNTKARISFFFPTVVYPQCVRLVTEIQQTFKEIEKIHTHKNIKMEKYIGHRLP